MNAEEMSPETPDQLGQRLAALERMGETHILLAVSDLRALREELMYRRVASRQDSVTIDSLRAEAVRLRSAALSYREAEDRAFSELSQGALDSLRIARETFDRIALRPAPPATEGS